MLRSIKKCHNAQRTGLINFYLTTDDNIIPKGGFVICTQFYKSNQGNRFEQKRVGCSHHGYHCWATMVLLPDIAQWKSGSSGVSYCSDSLCEWDCPKCSLSGLTFQMLNSNPCNEIAFEILHWCLYFIVTSLEAATLPLECMMHSVFRQNRYVHYGQAFLNTAQYIRNKWYNT